MGRFLPPFPSRLSPCPVSPLLTPSFLLHSCLLLPFFFTILPVSIAFPPLPLLPSPNTLSTLLLLVPIPPCPQPYKLMNQNFQDLPPSSRAYSSFPVLQTKSCETLSAGACTLFQGLLVLCSGMERGREGRHCPLLFPRLSPQGRLSQADALMPRERGSEAGGEGTWEGGGRAAAPLSQSSTRQGDQRK